MAGLIKREDIDEVRQRTDIKEIVDGYVTLKTAGLGSFKGLCPFHDERSPSFTVRPQVGRYHCFGCGEDGDAISFIQKMDHSSFHEAVEKLAARIGYELRYEDGGTGPSREEVGKRQRLLDAHKIADEFFRAQLLTPGAGEARSFLDGRGFDRAAAEHFGVGYAPQGWDALLKHLRGRGFTDAELKLTGMFSEGNRGIYDRFRGRLIWPIRDIAGDTIGFGARKLYEDDQGPKYLNTPETTLYKKSQVLYGIDLAKRSIAKDRQLVVVEGYTDVMACHLAGIRTAVATCGTAFGTEHIKIARRLLSDDGTGGEVVFTFDGDAAGQKAALRAFEEDQRFVAQTYVAVEPTGADPCDLRQLKGDPAVRELISSRKPLFEFAIRATLRKHNLDTVEGRVAALREAAPVVAQIRDTGIRPAYTRELAGWLGMPIEEVSRYVGAAAKRAASGGTPNGQPEQPTAATAPPSNAPAFNRPDPRDPVAGMERQALEVVLQEPSVLGGGNWERFEASHFSTPAYAAVHAGIRATGVAQAADPVAWVERVRQEVPDPLRPLVSELAVTPLPASTPEAMQRYCRDILARLFELQITRIKADKMGQLQRLDAAAYPEEFQRLNRELMQLEMQRRALRAEA
ncbi:DNA primase [Paenarthrobacter ureafaciens]|uniref:DNA primase n=1 Tax=Paenarthrobacter ureafaciens TaxID=37931 RepID=UPI0009AE1286|nr:DNA primase [Paenarthrobacter ureafaciens]GLU57964.1 DNA primase [Paenarthrobacter ureafaciens]GLU62659.1 DNA primase [Paenarthrobacter ureafaciens]GLU66853.1 DNA primase [Paenarthrobacter ureafaciens]GLU70845.1 DNA primase [Paenarthrobacter ureafaciens]GLU75466.1 DNA primase [Paenarthrobacter ureafaciens]